MGSYVPNTSRRVLGILVFFFWGEASKTRSGSGLRFPRPPSSVSSSVSSLLSSSGYPAQHLHGRYSGSAVVSNHNNIVLDIFNAVGMNETFMTMMKILTIILMMMLTDTDDDADDGGRGNRRRPLGGSVQISPPRL